jgi:hypothetical protein
MLLGWWKLAIEWRRYDLSQELNSGEWISSLRDELQWQRVKRRPWCFEMSIYNRWEGLECSASKREEKWGSILFNSQRTHLEFILNGTHTITEWITEMRDHIHRPEKLNWWCIAGVQLNSLVHPFNCLYKSLISTIKKIRERDSKKRERYNIKY